MADQTTDSTSPAALVSTSSPIMEFTTIEELDLKIFSLLGPSDLMRACLVSRSWCRFVSGNPFMRDIVREMVDVANTRVTFSNEHPDYALLIRALKYAPRINCLSEAVKASSHHHVDVYDNISNTVHDYMLAGPWMSRGRSDPSEGTEWLMYKLTELSLVGSIKIYLEPTYPSLPVSPVYGARSVRFIFGDMNEEGVFTTTFATPFFPMTQNRCQKFSLRKPLICIRKFLVVEFHEPVYHLMVYTIWGSRISMSREEILEAHLDFLRQGTWRCKLSLTWTQRSRVSLIYLMLVFVWVMIFKLQS
ncbi:F-box protein At4g00755-like isoform X2 [Raphanus sativus]|uniref:F-box protein At4g00755-like isoform X2 n=1 Tax=Raphanus sativus TaxID=3726 RepID=A0A9W3CU12_RAPSA|nr:F-box protein At4g00755-like isoform X2 [Raphanus sativus]XP_056854938.1 F-box protein At4g00755-like isoform X2 [Raphanus sativus]